MQQQWQNKKEDYSLYQDETPALLGVRALQPEPEGWRWWGLGDGKNSALFAWEERQEEAVEVQEQEENERRRAEEVSPSEEGWMNEWMNEWEERRVVGKKDEGSLCSDEFVPVAQ